MALSDSVPGVSGGTIAFVLGFYDKFIGSLNTLTSKKTSKDEKKEAVKFLKDNDVFSLPTDEALATLKNCPLNSIIIKITDAIEKDNTTVKEAAEGELKKQIEDLKQCKEIGEAQLYYEEIERMTNRLKENFRKCLQE